MSEINCGGDNKKSTKKSPSILYKKNKKGKSVCGWMGFLRYCIVPIVRVFYPFKYVGPKKVADGACVYVSNHYRMIDPMYLLPTTREGIHFIAKREAQKIPVLGFFVKHTKSICVSRDGNDVRALMDAGKCLKNGEKIAVYPEGTRNKSDQPFLPFKSGSAVLAIRAKVPIVPMVIYRKAKFLRKSYILIGEPFELDDFYGVKLTEDVLREADERILKNMEGLRASFEQSLAAKRKK